jgi:hypothetical protein
VHTTGWGPLAAAFALAATVALMRAAGAAAAPTWLSPQTVSGPGAQTPNVAVDAAGDAVAVWTKVEGGNYTVMAASRPAGGAWGAPVPIGTTGPEDSKCTTCSEPQVGMDASGRAFAVWSWYDSTLGQRKLLLRIRSAAGVWGQFATILSSIPNPKQQRLAVNAAGALAVVWNVFDGAHTVVQARFRSAAGAYSAVDTISAPGSDAYEPEVAIDGAGNATAVMARGPGTPANDYIDVSFRPAAGPWGASTPLSAVGGYEPHVAMNAAGNAVATWSRVDGSNVTRVEAAFRPAGSAWGAGVPISAPRSGGAFVQEPRVALGTAGAAVAVWTGSNGTNSIIQSASRTGGVSGMWGAAQNLSVGGANASNPRIAVAGAGSAVATWQRGLSPVVAQAAARTAAGTWGSPQTISITDTTASSPEVAADATGNAVAAWPGSDGTNGYIRASGFDGAGPRFDRLAVPPTGRVGTPVSFSVSPFDIWSALGLGPIWSFGDAGTSAGTAVSHTYSGAGSFQVTLSQADTVGNTSTTTRTIVIAAAPPPPPPPPAPPPPPPPPVTKCLVPKVVGKPLAKARVALRRRHCRVGRVTRAYSKRVRKGRVLAQRPKAGRKLKSGTKVNLVVSRGKKPVRH